MNETHKPTDDEILAGRKQAFRMYVDSLEKLCKEAILMGDERAVRIAESSMIACGAGIIYSDELVRVLQETRILANAAIDFKN